MNALKYFEDFLKIPRESGNEKEISNYLVNFAINNNLEYYVDEFYNVIIKRKSNNNSKNTIILQGHIDMVCNSIHEYDFKNNGIDWYIEEGMYKAKDTTLGADNGVGCSIILDVLSNKDIEVPNIESVFTVEEETTMNGAKRLDYSKITGDKLISIDGTNEGVIEVSSAGMTSIQISDTLEYTENDNPTYLIKVSGLLGGHSGVDINKNRGNAIKILADILNEIGELNLVEINGGKKDNVIPAECMCIISTSKEINVDNFQKFLKNGAKLEIKEVDICNKVINVEHTKEIIELLHKLPIEVLSYVDSFPQTSLNLAIIKIDDNKLVINISIRSNNTEDEKKWIDLVKDLSKNMNFKIVGEIPYFTYNKDSKLQKILADNYKKLYNKDIKLEHVHAGLEGGVFAQHIDNLDICVIAPNLYDIHTPRERVEIDSINRVYNWLIESLKEL